MRKSILILIVLAVIWTWIQSPDSTHSEQLQQALGSSGPAMAGLAIHRQPRQIELDAVPALGISDYTLQLRAEFGLVARVLGRQDYRWDRWSDLSPLDLALGWGPMSDSEVLSEINIAQGGRFYSWRVQQFPIARELIEQHSANMHIIPSSPELLKLLRKAKQGDQLRLSGYLVDVDRADGAYWRTSLRREDTGNGACEIFLVTSADWL